MDHHARVAQQRVEPGALGRRGSARGRTGSRRTRAARRRTRRSRAAPPSRTGATSRSAPAGEEQDQARPQRQQQHPQQQRALLRGPHRGGAVEGRRRRRGVRRRPARSEKSERRKAASSTTKATAEHAGQRVDRAAAGVDPLAAAARARRRARRRCRTGRTPSARIRQAWPTAQHRQVVLLLGRELRRALRHQRVLLADEHVALLADVDDDLAPLAERVGQRAGVADGHRGRAVAVADPEVQVVPVAADEPGDDLAGQLVGPARLRGGRAAGTACGPRWRPRSSCRRAPASSTAALSATTKRILRLRAGSTAPLWRRSGHASGARSSQRNLHASSALVCCRRTALYASRSTQISRRTRRGDRAPGPRGPQGLGAPPRPAHPGTGGSGALRLPLRLRFKAEVTTSVGCPHCGTEPGLVAPPGAWPHDRTSPR